MKRTMKFLGKAISALVLGVLAVGLALNADVRGNVGRTFGDMRSMMQVPATPKAVAAEVVRDGEYTGKEDVAAYIRKFNGCLPKNYVTKAQARALGWRGGPLEPYAPGKSIGGDRFGNYERRLPSGSYKECDIDTKGRPRGAKRLIYTPNGQRIYYTHDHYNTFEEVKEERK